MPPISSERRTAVPVENAPKDSPVSTHNYPLEGEAVVNPRLLSPKHPSGRDLVVSQIYLQSLLDDIDGIAQNAQTPLTDVYANSLLCTLREMRDKIPHDPYTHITWLFHNALAVNHRWDSYTTAQYHQAATILADYARRPHLELEHLGEAMVELEQAGFCTLPYDVVEIEGWDDSEEDG